MATTPCSLHRRIARQTKPDGTLPPSVFYRGPPHLFHWPMFNEFRLRGGLEGYNPFGS
ncbi:hypothetical protein IMZ48_32175 [Candidatus Bathyarchaeota archaeon]|nr:hypothetical protein [Candidatus Bathyarchaeota archaeon]